MKFAFVPVILSVALMVGCGGNDAPAVHPDATDEAPDVGMSTGGGDDSGEEDKGPGESQALQGRP